LSLHGLNGLGSPFGIPAKIPGKGVEGKQGTRSYPQRLLTGASK
jgi:hypothetical protein